MLLANKLHMALMFSILIKGMTMWTWPEFLMEHNAEHNLNKVRLRLLFKHWKVGRFLHEITGVSV